MPASIPTDAPREQVGDNPLVEGLERLPVAPTTMVIFGASGDLAARKLLPALYNLAHEGALPERFNLIGASRREQTDDEFRAVARESISNNSRREPDDAGPRGPARAHALRVGPVRRRRGLRQARREDRGARRGRRPAAGAHVLPVDRARVLLGDLRAAQGSRPPPPQGGGRPGRDREAVRHRPRVGAQAPGGRLERLPRAPGLPHRPLPRQGDGPEPAGVPVREPDVRAGLEPQLHRPRPDHRGRGHRDRHARRLLRHLGRAARPRPEPHAAAADAAVHGAAVVVRRRQGARREGQGARRDPAADGRSRWRR